MGMTPVEIRHVPIGRGLWGYRRGAVERFRELLRSALASVEETDGADQAAAA